MRPYLAILKDSLRDAIASRGLPTLLVLFTVALLAIAPIGIHESISWQLHQTDVIDSTLLIAKLRQPVVEGQPSASEHLRERLPESLAEHLDPQSTLPEAERFHADDLPQLVSAINEYILPDSNFYSPMIWDQARLSSEARELLDLPDSQRSLIQQKRLNRLLLSAAFPSGFQAPPPVEVAVTYAGNDLTEHFAPLLPQPELIRKMVRQLLYVVCVWGIGPIGLLIAILVTADLMPRTFEPGSIDLLLSKPINRALLFLTKFLGGCAFVVVSFSYLVLGLWLIFGFRLGEWSAQLWMVLPLFVFSFAVIYSVSALVGLLTRGPIVAILAAIAVWGVAFLVGFTNDIATTFREMERVDRIQPLDDTVLVSTPGRTAFLWDNATQVWLPRGDLWRTGTAAQPAPLMSTAMILGPVFDAPHNRYITANVGTGGANILQVGTAENGWKTEQGAAIPPGTRFLAISQDGRLFAAGLAGLFEFQGDPTIAKKEFKLFGLYDLVPQDEQNSFVRVDQEDGIWGISMEVALDRQAGQAILYRQGELTRLERGGPDEHFQTAVSRQIVPRDAAQPALVAITADYVLLAEKSGRVQLLDTETLATTTELNTANSEPPRAVATNPQETHAAILFHDGRLGLIDLQNQSYGEPLGAANISAIAFDQQGQLWVADRLRRVRALTIPSFHRVHSHEGSLGMMERIYRYGLTPLSYLLPDTYGLRDVYQYLFTDETSEAVSGDETDLKAQRLQFSIKRPLLQNTLFLMVILGLGCWYVTRKDF